MQVIRCDIPLDFWRADVVVHDEELGPALFTGCMLLGADGLYDPFADNPEPVSVLESGVEFVVIVSHFCPAYHRSVTYRPQDVELLACYRPFEELPDEQLPALEIIGQWHPWREGLPAILQCLGGAHLSVPPHPGLPIRVHRDLNSLLNQRSDIGQRPLACDGGRRPAIDGYFWEPRTDDFRKQGRALSFAEWAVN